MTPVVDCVIQVIYISVRQVAVDKPKVGKLYFFVRQKGDSFEHTEFTRHEDGSSGFAADGFFHVHEGNSDAWRGALQALAELGFQELEEARTGGVVPMDWQPSSETHVLASSQGGPNA